MKRLIHLATCAALVSLGGCAPEEAPKPTAPDAPGIQNPDRPDPQVTPRAEVGGPQRLVRATAGGDQSGEADEADEAGERCPRGG